MENNNNQNLTVWQRLQRAMGPNALLNQDYPVYKFDKEQLLKTTSKQEYEREKLEAQQTFFLSNQWAKIESNLYTQAVYYEPTRMASYYDYESMEYTPEISAALDIYAEESTTPDKDGHILQIYSESKRIKSVLADLFNNRLDINTNLPMWTRNTCKFGDNFVYLKLDPEKGIVGCQQLPNIQIERLEKGMRFQPDKYSQEMENDALKFTWKEKNMEFNVWEMAHFRILGDDRKLPYLPKSGITSGDLVPFVTYFSAVTGDTVHTYMSDLKDYIVILAHNFLDYIIRSLKQDGYTGKFIVLLPNIRVI